MEQQRFSVEVIDGYIKLKTWGKLEHHDLEAPANAALQLAVEKNIDKLLDDIREIDVSSLNIPIQTKSVGILWKLRQFKKVAIVMNTSRLRSTFFATLEALGFNLDDKFKAFDNEEEAIVWLTAEPQEASKPTP